MKSKIRRKGLFKYLLSVILILTGLLITLYVTLFETFSPPTLDGNNGSSESTGSPIIINPDFVWIPSMIFMIILIFVVSIAYTQSSRKYYNKPQNDFKKRPNVAISFAKRSTSTLPVSDSMKILSEIQNSHRLIQTVNEDELNDKIEMTLLTEDIIKKIELINWEDEMEKSEFIQEMLALRPDEREEIIDFMLEKYMEG